MVKSVSCYLICLFFFFFSPFALKNVEISLQIKPSFNSYLISLSLYIYTLLIFNVVITHKLGPSRFQNAGFVSSYHSHSVLFFHFLDLAFFF